jgi:DNA repair exonuclease SbcCD nuclease subunit
MPYKIVEQKIEELKAELLNQYGAVIVFLTNWDFFIQQFQLNIIKDESMPAKTNKDRIASIKSIGLSTLGLVKQIKKYETKSYFGKEESQEIYRTMLVDQEKSRYEQFQKDYKYSIRDLIGLFEQLDSLSDNLSNLSLKEAEDAFNKIFYQYIALDTINYGIGNQSLKRRIDKTRVILGSKIQVRSQKNEIIKQIILQEYKKGKNWKSPDQVAKYCIEVIELEFEKFDTEWLKDKLKELELDRLNKLRKLSELDEDDPKYKKIEQLIASMTKGILNIQDVLKKGYPYEEYNNFLSYGTEYIEKSVANALRREKSLLEVVLKKD